MIRPSARLTASSGAKATAVPVMDQPQPGDPSMDTSSVAPKIVVKQGGVPKKVKNESIAIALYVPIIGPFWGATKYIGSEMKHNKKEVFIEQPDSGKLKPTYQTPAEYDLTLRTQVEANMFEAAKLSGDYTQFNKIYGLTPSDTTPAESGTGKSFWEGIASWFSNLGGGGSMTTIIIIAVVILVFIMLMKG